MNRAQPTHTQGISKIQASLIGAREPFELLPLPLPDEPEPLPPALGPLPRWFEPPAAGGSACHDDKLPVLLELLPPEPEEADEPEAPLVCSSAVKRSSSASSALLERPRSASSE